jgi:glycosyltransferase involved in cell wall biosynthesis
MMEGNSALQRPVVSVILPTFNRLQYLPAAVSSVFAQTYDSWELIIADDGSDTETRAYLSSLAGSTKVRVLWLPHSGNPGAVRNFALREAQGEYIAFLDSDDLWMPAKLELQIAALRACPSRQWSYTAISHIDSFGKEIYAELQPQYVYYEGQVFEGLLTSEVRIALPTVMVSTQLIERVGGFAECHAQREDYHLWLRLACVSELGVLRQRLACIRHHSDHFSNRGIASLEDNDRMLGNILVTNPRQRTAVRVARARNAALLAGATAAAGNSYGAWRALASSWRFSWRYAFWWLAIPKVLAHIYLPVRLKATLQEFRRARRASLP